MTSASGHALWDDAEVLGELRHRAARIISEPAVLSGRFTSRQEAIGARRVPRGRTGEPDTLTAPPPDTPDAT
ncbi:hypothetical protein Cme02nite_19240 [Catellatospora methionotrophica]|uniref:Uncharacterized protein n=1 Tax=Catellatospora methionotrophica TaxID=121620 RepID=A0A8J3PDY8_9ACTN|nr:hypothetical protein Cme02nite_19240 [Catellatospora methionotrophica]